MKDNIVFYSECDTEWVDCVAEDESYLRNQTNFYDTCEVITGFEGNEELLNASKSNCFENQKCENGQILESSENFVGSCIQSKCIPFENDPSSNSEKIISRYKRQTEQKTGTGEVYATSSVNTRVLRSALGDTRIVKDSSQLFRTAGSYSDANRIVTDVSKAFDEEAFELGF